MKRLADLTADPDLPVLEADVIVLGSGMAGYSAAARAAELGARVIVVEKSRTHGGSAILSGGYVWTAATLDRLQEEDPGGDPELARTLVEDYVPALAWVESTGVLMGDTIPILGIGRGRQVDMRQYFDRCAAMVTSHGGHVLLDVSSSELVLEDDAVAGLLVRRAGEDALLRAPAVVLATGGFQGNREMVTRYVTPHPDRLLLRSNPNSTGDGIAIGLEVGGSLTESTAAGFYGHLFPSPMTDLAEADFTRLSQYQSDKGVLLASDGRRFCDESRGDHNSTQDVLRQDGARAVLVIDERIMREDVLKAFVPGLEVGVDKMRAAGDMGARYATADTVEDLADRLADWGLPAEAVAETLRSYNAAVGAGRGAELDPPRRGNQQPLDEPPYAAVEVMAAITFTFGGLRTDRDGRVLRGDDGPVPGLYAAGADMGGVFARGYAGGLARGLVFGRRAAAAAVADRTTV